MTRFSELIQPASLGVGLFAAAAVTLIATIACSLVNLVTVSHVLLQVAQPLCAGAIAVLIYLVRIGQSIENA